MKLVENYSENLHKIVSANSLKWITFYIHSSHDETMKHKIDLFMSTFKFFSDQEYSYLTILFDII